MDDEMRDYSVDTKVAFRLTVDSPESNSLMLDSVRQSFAGYVRDVYNSDEDLASHVAGNLDFRFRGRDGDFQYTFTCHDENKAEAEGFSKFCVRGVQRKLEAFGCKIKGISCTAEEMSMDWLDELEDAIFGRPDTGTRKPQMHTGKKRPGVER